MNFAKEISKAYSDLGLIPFNGQDEAVDKVLTEFFIHKKHNVILSADTGTGKSIIAAVVAKVFEEKFAHRQEKTSFILMHTNSLVQQYAKTFESFPPEQFYQVKGAGQYVCEAARALTDNKDATAESCITKKIDPMFQEEFCWECDYSKAKKHVNTTENLITNYSYFLVSKMWSKHLDDRILTVFDEGHTINDIFSDHCAVHITEAKLDSYIKECESSFPTQTADAIRIFIKSKVLIRSGGVNESNYKSFVIELAKAYKIVSGYTKTVAESANIDSSVKHNKLHRKYHGLFCKIDDFLNYKYEHVFDYNEDAVEIAIKPIFVGEMSSVLMGEYNLFMSATISDEFMKTTLHIHPDTIGFVKLDPVYDPSHKQVIFCAPTALNYEAMKNPKTIETLKKICKTIIDDHSAKKEKGLILVPSFFLGKQIADAIKIPGLKIFCHQGIGPKLVDLIKQFKAYKGSAVLISPSIFEGLDFADDFSRYQIIVKAPYPSLGDKRIKTIANKYPDIYRLITLKKIIQGIGRSIRSKDDWAVTYILDRNAETLFNSRQNVWKDQFEVL